MNWFLRLLRRLELRRTPVPLPRPYEPAQPRPHRFRAPVPLDLAVTASHHIPTRIRRQRTDKRWPR